MEGEVVKFWAGIELSQFPVLVNHATTIHKLQGQTLSHLYISNFSYQRNWIYVALSRVTKREGLFLRSRIDRSKNFTPHSDLKSMLYKFRHKTPRYVGDNAIDMTGV